MYSFFHDWKIGPDGNVTDSGSGAATVGDEDTSFALVMATRKWGGQGLPLQTQEEYAIKSVILIWECEVDFDRDYMLKAGNS
ncbi:MAG: hypothetical protein JXR76_22710 [Deltaproteobacteria bacterium]|nr:hypothetical protein [Deltaproteobacteria bacterium]